MTISTSIQDVTGASVMRCEAGEYHPAFDSVTVNSVSGGYVCIFMPEGTGKAVADAINAAFSRVALPVMDQADA